MTRAILSPVARPSRLEAGVVDAWLKDNPAWAREGEALVRTFRTPDFAAALALAVRVGMAAERRDHHPDILVGWGKARFAWTTHDAGGITELDLELARITDTLAG